MKIAFLKQFHEMKVVIPRTACSGKKNDFSTPEDNIYGKDTSGGPFQSPDNDLSRDSVRSQHEWTEDEKLVKNSHNFEAQKIAVIQAKSVFYRKNRFFSKLESEDAKLCWWIEQP